MPDDKTEKTGKVSSSRVYSGRVISVDVDEVRFPDGSIGKLEMVRHPGASAIVPLLDDGPDPRVLLIRQYRYAADGFVYEIPAGRLDAGESPERCAKRELEEETGYDAGKLERLATFYTTPGFTDERIHLYVAEQLTEGKHRREPDEFLEVCQFRLSRAIEMIRAGEIVDGKTSVGIFLTYLNRHGQ